MKYLIVLSLIVSSIAWSKTTENFNRALNEDLKQDIQKDDFKYKSRTMRGPASAEPMEVIPSSNTDIPKEVQKIEKVKQLGPNNW